MSFALQIEKMIFTQMKEKTMHINLPKSLNELTDWQLKEVMKVVELYGSYTFKNKYRMKLITLRLLVILMLGKFTFKKLYQFFVLIKNVPLLDPVIQENIQFIFKLDELTKFPKKVKCGFLCRLYGPADRLANLTIYEFNFADLFFYEWIKTKDIAALNRLVSVLYRPKADQPTDADMRRPFVKEALPRISEKAVKIDHYTKLAIAHAFGGSRVLIEKQFSQVFPKRKKTADNSGKYVLFEEIINQFVLSENKPLGNLYETQNSYMYDFLKLLNVELKNQKELERKYAK